MVASAVAVPMGVLLGDAYDNAVLGATVTVLLGDAVIFGVVAIRGGVHTSVDEESPRWCSCGSES